MGLLLYIEKDNAPGRRESSFGSRAPERGMGLLYIDKNNFLCLGCRESSFGSTTLEHGMSLFLYIEKRDVLHPGAENHPLDLANPRAEWAFFSV